MSKNSRINRNTNRKNKGRRLPSSTAYSRLEPRNLLAVNLAPTFSVGDGIVTTSFSSGDDYGQRAVLQSDGKIVRVGSVDYGSNGRFAIARHLPNGQLDPSFGGGGIVTTNLTAGNEIANSVAIQADGKIVALGAAENAGAWDFAITRYLPNGSLDTTFGGGDGIALLAIGSADDHGKNLAIQPDGKIIVSGQTKILNQFDFALARLNSDGSLDQSFGGGDGIVTTNLNQGDDINYGLAIQPDGKILTSGYCWNGLNQDFAVVRYNTSGELDTSFGGGDGIAITDISNADDLGWLIAVQADGRIFVAGSSFITGSYAFSLAKYLPNGQLDTSFGNGSGVVLTQIGPGEDWGGAIYIQNDGKIIQSGYTGTSNTSDYAVARFLPNGSLDSSFGGGDGISILNTGSTSENGGVEIVLADGRLIAAGLQVNNATMDFSLIRYLPDGNLDLSFDGNDTLGGSVTYTENGSPVVLDSDVQVYDPELSGFNNFSGASFDLYRNGGPNSQDIFSATGSLGALTQGGNLVVGGITIGTVTKNSGGNLAVFFNSNATNTRVNQALRQIAYSNSSDNPPSSIQLIWSFNDGNTGGQGTGGALVTNGSMTVNITPMNDVPTLDQIADITVDDGKQYTINLSGITAGGGESQPLRVTASSSNSAAIPNPPINYQSPNQSGSLTFSVAPDQAGQVFITVTVEDGGLDNNLGTTADNAFFSRSFRVTISPVNDLPTLNSIGDLFLYDGSNQVVDLGGITAGGNENQPLRVTASSNNPSLISSPSVTYQSPNQTGTITFAPLVNRSGYASITVTVEDGGLDKNLNTTSDNAVFSRIFQVTVNYRPTLGLLNDISVEEDAPQQTITLSGITAGANESQPLRVTAASSNIALVPNPNVNYQSPNSNGSLNFTPVSNQSGTTTITVVVEDGGLDNNLSTPSDNATFTRTFTILVNPVNDLPTLDPLSDIAIDEDALEQTIGLAGLTAGGGESQIFRVAASCSNTSLIPNPNVDHQVPNQTGSIRFAPNSDQFGEATITISVEDGGLDNNLSTTNDNAIFSRTFIVVVRPVNDVPTIDQPNQLTLNEDASLQNIELSGITAGGSEFQPLRVTASSDNPALIPIPAVNYQSPSETGSISFTPVVNQSGIATITITVEDGGLDRDLNTSGDNAVFRRSFQVSVSPVNDIPTLNPINDVLINEDSQQRTVVLGGITAGGGESQPLKVTALSGNTSLIPNPQVDYLSPGKTGSIYFTPVANQSGTTTIIVTVEDGGLDGNILTTADNGLVSRTFQIVVSPINDSPTLNPINDLSINEDSPTQTISLDGISAGGGESQVLRVNVSSSNPELVSEPAVNYLSPNSNGTISFAPAADKFGTVSITVSVEDGGLDNDLNTAGDNLTFTRTFQVAVNPVNDQPTLNQLDDLNIPENLPQQSIQLSGVSAGGGESQPIRISASSSNTGLVPTPSVAYQTANSTGILSFTTIPNQTGTATITVTVEDGGLDNNLETPADNGIFRRTFGIFVTPVNDRPTLNSIADVFISEDAPQRTVNLSGITAGGNESQPLRVTVTSSNPALIPTPTVNYVSPNQIGTISFTPVANQSGFSTITATVEDGGFDGNLETAADNATFSRTFQVYVNAVNDAPVITNLGGDINYRENVVVARLCNAVRIQDIDTPIFNNGALRVAISSGAESSDRLWLTNSEYLTVNGNQLLFAGLIVGSFTGGTNFEPLQVTFNNRASINRVQHVLRCVCFAHDSDNPTATQRTVSIQVNDGAGGQVAATKRVNVIPVNDRPMLSGIPASSTYTLNATSVLIAPNAIVTDPDNANFAGGQLSIRYFGGQDASNRLITGGFFSFDAANNLLRNGAIVGQRNASGGIGENNLVVTFNASATKAVVQEFMRSIFFQTVGGTSKASRYLEFSLTDGLGGTSNLVTTRIDVV